jgi:hypothetical protein
LINGIPRIYCGVSVYNKNIGGKDMKIVDLINGMCIGDSITFTKAIEDEEDDTKATSPVLLIIGTFTEAGGDDRYIFAMHDIKQLRCPNAIIDNQIEKMLGVTINGSEAHQW